MKGGWANWLLPLAVIGLPGTALAQDGAASLPGGRVFRVDDSGTVVLDPSLEMQWQPTGPSRGSKIVSAGTRVSVQLNLATWVGQSGRIYMILPPTVGPTVRATWTTGGALLPGTLLSSERTLVYAGPVRSAVMRDLIDIKLEVDGTRLTEPQALAFGFEIEVDQ